ncbi:MAG: ClpXP protease specificity-enhancing factor [Candidatus Thioglobus sp.]|jgi:stringent starvation protein B|nr:ClpXP protease specificity-enhancing factor [Candidatus Thioglobus sp.]MBT3965134.1 ClpXP protease specificity-enhancing factor [Candidatus Thioglobus sp.]MBT4315503.1 ClpXP protease specificity-enhancing factor [Candidatus Thioglobus sp.]MBT5286866.1 ClpXP protease specificity-enhancing factor [Candidatus Thioglobus sp.]MBT5783624.1 ClpXP protease specificity-enhancing factor [Candidatus Thioglobus sp.]
MASVAPYLIRAYHQWMEDSSLTPHILVDCSKEGTIVPKPYIQQGKIVLNISTNASSNLTIGNQELSFKARFNNKSQEIHVPIDAVLSIYAGENGEGMFFENDGNPKDPTKPTNKPNLTLLD